MMTESLEQVEKVETQSLTPGEERGERERVNDLKRRKEEKK